MRFSADGTRLLSGSEDKTIKVWDAIAKDNFRYLRGHRSNIYSLCFSPDGKRIASAGAGIRLWDTASGQQISQMEGRKKIVKSIHFRSDGARVVAVNFDGAISVWDADTGKRLETFEQKTAGASCVRYSPDGTTIASGHHDHAVILWHADKGTPRLTLKGHANAVYQIDFSPNGKRLASSSYDGTIKIWVNRISNGLRLSFDGASGRATVPKPVIHPGRRIITAPGFCCADFSQGAPRYVCQNETKTLARFIFFVLKRWLGQAEQRRPLCRVPALPVSRRKI